MFDRKPVAGRLRCIAALIALLVSNPILADAVDEAGWIAFADGHHVPAIEVEVNGETTVALIDTAMSVNALSESFAHRAGISFGDRSISVRDVRDNEQLPVSGNFTLGIGGADVGMDSAVILPIEQFGLVLGRPVLKALLVQIHYPERKLRLLPLGASGFEGNVRAKRGRFHQPMIRTQIDGRTSWLTLDTSNDTFSLIARDFAAAKLDVEALDSSAYAGSGIPMWPDMRLVRLGRLELGPFNVEGVVAAVPSGDIAASATTVYGGDRIHARTGADGVLGYELLRNFVLTMSIERDEYHLYPP